MNGAPGEIEGYNSNSPPGHFGLPSPERAALDIEPESTNGGKGWRIPTTFQIVWLEALRDEGAGSARPRESLGLFWAACSGQQTGNRRVRGDGVACLTDVPVSLVQVAPFLMMPLRPSAFTCGTFATCESSARIGACLRVDLDPGWHCPPHFIGHRAMVDRQFGRPRPPSLTRSHPPKLAG